MQFGLTSTPKGWERQEVRHCMGHRPDYRRNKGLVAVIKCFSFSIMTESRRNLKHYNAANAGPSLSQAERQSLKDTLMRMVILRASRSGRRFISTPSLTKLLLRWFLAVVSLFLSPLSTHSFVHNPQVLVKRGMRISSGNLAATRDSGSTGNEGLLNPLLSTVEVSKTIEIHAMTKSMEARGEAVVSLCVGEPDFPPPAGTFIFFHMTTRAFSSMRSDPLNFNGVGKLENSMASVFNNCGDIQKVVPCGLNFAYFIFLLVKRCESNNVFEMDSFNFINRGS